MNILLSTDNNYVMPTGVLMTSIGYHDGGDVNYHILVDKEFTIESRRSLTRVAEEFGNRIYFYTILPEMTKDFPFGRADQPTHVTIATYYRLFVTEFLPKTVEKIIYLDGDIIVRKSLTDLWMTDMDNYALGVVGDMHEVKHIKSGRLPYDIKNEGYFNAGVLLINVKYWRENNCLKAFYDDIEKYQDLLILHDQDVLNITFHDKKKWLSVTYNMQTGFLFKNQKMWHVPHIEEDLNVMKHDPIIVHYTTLDKPWKLECFHPYCKDWRKYFFRTQWKNEKLEDEEEHPTLKRRFRNWLVRHCWYVPANLYQKL